MEIKISLKELLDNKSINKVSLIRTDNDNLFLVIVNGNYLDSMNNAIYFNSLDNTVIYKGGE